MTNSSLQTLRFCIRLLVKDIAGESAPPFAFQLVEELMDFDIDVESNDVLHNLVTKETQMMRGTILWRGCREKDPLFLQMLIEVTTSPGDIVLDCSASTGSVLWRNFSLFTCLHRSFNSSDDQLILPNISPILFQEPRCTHVERPAVISLRWRTMS